MIAIQNENLSRALPRLCSFRLFESSSLRVCRSKPREIFVRRVVLKQKTRPVQEGSNLRFPVIRMPVKVPMILPAPLMAE